MGTSAGRCSVLLSLLIVNFAFGQDFHFSQFYVSPIVINPATTGAFEGDYRLVSSYKEQWKTIGRPYKTKFASADLRLHQGKNKNYLSGGLSFLSDKAGSVNMGLTQANMTLAYNIKLNKRNTLAAGLLNGFAQKSMNLSLATWSNQFNGDRYDAGINPNENSNTGKKAYWDAGGGMYWVGSFSDNISSRLGVSMLHVNKPNQSFYSKEENLNTKISVHGGCNISPGNTNITFMPDFLYTRQGPTKEVLAGSQIKYVLGVDSKYTGINNSSAIYFGAFYRYRDALIVSSSLDFKHSFTLGLSYDINISELKQASKGRGGAEITLKYRGFFINSLPQTKVKGDKSY